MIWWRLQVESGDPLSGMFRYTANLTGSGSLSAGQYVIAGNSGVVDLHAWDPVNPVWGAGITFGQDRYEGGNFLHFPTLTSGVTGFMGPNFEFRAVPEPATFVVIGLGLSALAIVRRRK